jgi:hypothetical protein
MRRKCAEERALLRLILDGGCEEAMAEQIGL